MTTIRFTNALRTILVGAARQNLSFIDVRAGHLHKLVGGYPGPSHRMPICCDVMLAAMKGRDVVLRRPPKGKGASLTIRYQLS